MKHNFTAKNKDIELRPMDANTSEEYRKLRNKENIKRYFFTNGEITSEEQQRWFERYLKDDTQAMFAIFKEKQFIGGIGFYDLDEKENWVEVGRIIINPELAKGKGYGRMAIELLVNIILDNYSLDVVGAYIYSDNIASIKSFYRAGFIKDEDYISEGIVKMLYKGKGML